MMKADRVRDPLSTVRSRGEGGVSVPKGLGTWASTMKEKGGVNVVTMDSGTWPLYGGGVAVCRKQVRP